MKKILSLIAVTLMITFIFSLFSASTVSAQPTQSGKITVTGCGQVTLVPDTAMIAVGVKTTADTLEQANTENKEKISKLYETLKANDIAEQNIKTKNFYVNEEYSYKETESTLIGYTVSNQVLIKTTNLEKLTTLVSSLVQDGANYFNGINFTSSQENESYKTALSNALNDANEKAKILTNSENVNIVEIIEESVSSFRNFASYSKAEMMSDNSFFGGELIVKARVTVVFNTQINDATLQDNIKENLKTNREIAPKQTTDENNETLPKQATDKNNETLPKQATDKNNETLPKQATDKNENQTKTETIENNNNEVVTNQTDNKKEETIKSSDQKIDVSEPTNPPETVTNQTNTKTTQEKPITLPKRPLIRRPSKPTSPQII